MAGPKSLIVGDSEKAMVMDILLGNPKAGHACGLTGQLDEKRIHFLGRIPHHHLISILQISTVHVYLSYPFVLGWSLLEAMACGCCIVGSDNLPVTEVIQNGVDGLLVPITDPDILTNRIDHLLMNPNLRKSLSSSARLKALQYDQNSTLPRSTTHRVDLL